MTHWLKAYRGKGLRPYVATSAAQLDALDLSLLGDDPLVVTLEDAGSSDFHHAYLTANALAFGARDLKMPGWVYIDCVLMQTAVVGFVAPRDSVPAPLRAEFLAEADVDWDALEWVPVSGQIASAGIDGKTLVGFSLFSLTRGWDEMPSLGTITKAMALEVYRAQQFDRFLGITQYDNKALRMHGRFGPKLEIVSAQVPLHAQGEQSLVYGMKVDFDRNDLDKRLGEVAVPDFWLEADDIGAIRELTNGIAAGDRYFILPPFRVEEEGKIKLPIRRETAS